MALDIITILRQMGDGETREVRKATVAAVTVTRIGRDEFKINAGPATSFPNTIRLLWDLGLQ